MIDWSWITTSPIVVSTIVFKAILIYVALIFFTRLSGLRSFSKMASFDFVITVSMGTILGSTVLTEDPALLQAIVGLATLYAIQYAVSWARRHSQRVGRTVDNQPLLLMAGSEILTDNLTRARVTHEDLYAKLREANVLDLSQVRAVVFESTGEISVLHIPYAATPHVELDLALLGDVRDVDRLPMAAPAD
jgi:uncharacterized membrane protein YcaP (DUF421 family)